jgi:hypothetical protein
LPSPLLLHAVVIAATAIAARKCIFFIIVGKDTNKKSNAQV